MRSETHFSKLAHWHSHVNAVRASRVMASWLTYRYSLTEKLIASSNTFRVQRLQQNRARCLHDEFAPLGIVGQQKVTQREVLLRCDEVAVVYAHTVMALSANATQWPLFASLGNRSLGSTLFSDPLVERGILHFARLKMQHPLMQRIMNLGLLTLEEGVHLGQCKPDLIYQRTDELLARRCIFKRKGANLLVTEVFLPSILRLK